MFAAKVARPETGLLLELQKCTVYCPSVDLVGLSQSPSLDIKLADLYAPNLSRFLPLHALPLRKIALVSFSRFSTRKADLIAVPPLHFPSS